jgi:benzoyl-CoA reductase/2-hydroxyglutaryl-CoA dehydratase subunit BcrC/BadD/HgdB
MKSHIEAEYGVKITDSALWESITLFNRTRELLGKLYDLRKADAPPISGAETMEVVNAAFRMPKEQYNELLEKLLAEIASTNRSLTGKVRLLINGSPLNNPEFLQTIEDLGGMVVMDELCMGSRYWWEIVDTDHGSDSLEAISRRYLNNFPCARMVPSDGRFDRVLDLVKDYRIDGVVNEIIRYCVPYAHDEPLLRERLENKGVPVLELDVEYGVTGSGQIRTRAQAFIEMILDSRD